MKLPDEIREKFVKAGRKGGKIGGKRRAESLTQEERSAISRKGAVVTNAKKAAKKK